MSAFFSRIAALIIKYHQAGLTPDETKELNDWIGDSAERHSLFKELTDPDEIRAALEKMEGYSEDSIRAAIIRHYPDAFSEPAAIIRKAGLSRQKIMRYAAAAAVLLAAASYLWLHREHRQPPAVPIAERYKNDVPPGGQKAVLTLANGSRIVLDSAQNGLLTQQGNTQVLKLDSGQLSYKSSQMQPGMAAQYNVLTTPRGGQYKLILPDGTKVWLNAASSLRFPTVFTGKSREVTLTGEAYFEVADNKRMPFRVHAGSTMIEDIGTHFNIMAYPDEETVKTTLLEGVVSVSIRAENKVLKPGEQAVVNNAMPADINVHQADLEEAVAWTNGGFYFHHTNIYEIMRQISRWYDVEVNYEDSVDVYLSGNIRRDVNASEVFRMLELAGEVRFKIEGREITVIQ